LLTRSHQIQLLGTPFAKIVRRLWAELLEYEGAKAAFAMVTPQVDLELDLEFGIQGFVNEVFSQEASALFAKP
jgi:hypothetical protein